ncbi:hypothetical protein SAMN05428957_107105 [Oryzisolibacter propanilivorax]|uniref:Uncharacterized protein n=1 Tax=Oryzisolibacter propanilivorax TaxID=1527607 RepID=A0A1G9U0K2_9BURK|nr:hypothetical protein [Oryzisolibacter propanilivorax]SDM53408.1 hypothetical protein SAMN05428957_107105 [Oryzisolibacter propanilivorax]
MPTEDDLSELYRKVGEAMKFGFRPTRKEILLALEEHHAGRPVPSPMRELLEGAALAAKRIQAMKARGSKRPPGPYRLGTPEQEAALRWSREQKEKDPHFFVRHAWREAGWTEEEIKVAARDLEVRQVGLDQVFLAAELILK